MKIYCRRQTYAKNSLEQSYATINLNLRDESDDSEISEVEGEKDSDSEEQF
jgi:hypothetical protein